MLYPGTKDVNKICFPFPPSFLKFAFNNQKKDVSRFPTHFSHHIVALLLVYTFSRSPQGAKGTGDRKRQKKPFHSSAALTTAICPTRRLPGVKCAAWRKHPFWGHRALFARGSNCHSVLCSTQRKKFACMGLSRCHRIFWSNGNLPFRAAPHRSWPREVFSCRTSLLPSCPRELPLRAPQIPTKYLAH